MIYKKCVLLLEMENVHFPHLLLIIYFYQKTKTQPGSPFLERLGVVELTVRIQHELLTWQFTCLVAFLLKIYMLLCKGRAVAG